MAANSARGGAPRAGSSLGQPGVEFSGDRRRASLRLLWLVWAVLPQRRGRVGLESRLWPDAIAARTRRGKLARPSQGHANRQLGPRRAARSSSALDKRTGQVRWKVKRNEVTSWATPIIVDHAGKTQVIVSGTNRVRGYDLANGKVIWECGGLSSNIVASPVSADGMVFAGSSYDKRALLAIRLDGAKGDITGSDRIAWSRIRGTPYVPSPRALRRRALLLDALPGHSLACRCPHRRRSARRDPLGRHREHLLFARRRRRPHLRHRLGGIHHRRQQRRSAAAGLTERLSEPISASAAIAGRQLFLRGDKHLYCLEERDK